MMMVMNVPRMVTIEIRHITNINTEQPDDDDEDDDDNVTFAEYYYQSPLTQSSLLSKEVNDEKDSIINVLDNVDDDEEEKDCESLCNWSDCSSVTMDPALTGEQQYFLPIKNYRKAAGIIVDDYTNRTIRNAGCRHRCFRSNNIKKSDSLRTTTAAAPRIPIRRGSISTTTVPFLPMGQHQHKEEEESSSANEEVYSHPLIKEQLSVRRISDTTLITVDQYCTLSKKVFGSGDYCSAPPRLEQIVTW